MRNSLYDETTGRWNAHRSDAEWQSLLTSERDTAGFEKDLVGAFEPALPSI
jgi:hypothetical protein